MKKIVALLIMVTMLISACGTTTNKTQLDTAGSSEPETDVTSDSSLVDSSEHTDYNKLLYDGQYVAVTLDALYHDHMEFTVESKLQNNKCSVYLETVALDGLVPPASYSETSWIELNPSDTTKSTINSELNYTEHKYLSAFFQVFDDEGNSAEEISIVNYEIGEKENIEYDEPQEILAYDSATLSVYYVGPDENGVRLRAKNKMDKTVHMVLDAPYNINEKDVGEYTNASPIPPYATADYYVNVKEFYADYSPDSVSSFSCTGRTYDGETIDEFFVSSNKEVASYSGEMLQGNTLQDKVDHGESVTSGTDSSAESESSNVTVAKGEENSISGGTSSEKSESSNNITVKTEENTAAGTASTETDEGTSVMAVKTEEVQDIKSRAQINDYKKKRVEKYINCFKNAGVEYNVSANGCYVVGKETEREILDNKYKVLEFSCSVYDQRNNEIKDGVEIQYDVHPEIELDEENEHMKLLYEFYSMAEENPIDLSAFIIALNEARNQKEEGHVLKGNTYYVYSTPSRVGFVLYDSIPCDMETNEEYKYIEFDSLEEREKYIDSINNTIPKNDLKVSAGVHGLADRRDFIRFDNNLGLDLGFTLYASFNNDIPVDEYRKLLVKPIEKIGLNYIIDKDVTADDIANEIISCSQISRYSRETDMYIDDDPAYNEYNTCILQKDYGFNPLQCDQYISLLNTESDKMKLFVPAKVQGLKNK